MSNDNKTLADVRNLIVCDTQFGWTGSTTLKMQEMIALQDRGWVVEGEDNLEFDLTDAGREVVARALQNAVQPTLADAQHGGRVRLGDADPMRSALEDALQFVETLHSTVAGDSRKIVWRCLERGRAALSAQPSPGGQGDSRSERAATFLRQYLTYLRSSPRQGLRPRWCDVYEALEVAIEALAARQPVGEPIAEVVLVNGVRKLRVYPDEGLPSLLQFPVGTKFYTAAPAQAVDLGAVRDAVHGISLGFNGDLPYIKGIKEALALIDSQAVGNG